MEFLNEAKERWVSLYPLFIEDETKSLNDN